MSSAPTEPARKDLFLDQIEELLDPVLRQPGDELSSAHDLILDADPFQLLSALFDAGLLRLGQLHAGEAGGQERRGRHAADDGVQLPA